ncbi:MAG: hypothetical protein ACSHWY_02405 [Octadecabacter sp.]
MSNLLNSLRPAALFAAFMLAPVAALAQANCPTADMLNGGGIRFTQSNGDQEIHRLAQNGAIAQEISYGEYSSLNYLAYGVHVLQLSDLENGRIVPESIWQFSFPMQISELPEPVAGGTWRVNTSAIFEGEAIRETIVHRWGALATFTIGNCTLSAIPVTVKYSNADERHTEEVMYFPALKTGVLTAYIADGVRDDFSYSAVRGQ